MGKSKYLGKKKINNNKTETGKAKKKNAALQVKSWSAAANVNKNKSFDDFIFDATAYLDDVLFGGQYDNDDHADKKKASKDAATAALSKEAVAYPIINIAPLEDDEHSSVSSSSETSYEEIEVVIEDGEVLIEEEEEEAMEEEEEEEVIVEESSEKDDELRCNACGLEAYCVPEGMVSCLRCRKVSYCSVDCMQWDFTSGDHISVCVEIK